MVAQYNLFVDWSGDGDFADTGEDVSARTFGSGVRWERGRDQVRALAPPFAGTLAATLDNSSGDYAPENTGSPLYGDVEAGREVLLQSVSGGTTNLFRGYLEEPTLDSEQQTVNLRALGKLSRLAGNLISSHFYANITTSEAFGHVCRLAGLAAGDYTALDTGQTTLTAWWCKQDDAFAMLTRILAAEGPGAAIYEQADGKIAFHSRHYRLLTSRCTTSQATFRDTGADPLHVPPYRYDRGVEGVVNRASILVKTATLAGAATVVWEWEGSLVIQPGETVAFDILLDEPCEDFSLSTYGATGGGTSNAFVSGGDAMVSASGAHVVLTITNVSSPAQATTLTSLEVEAKVYGSAEETVSHSVDASASQEARGIRDLPSSFVPWPYIDDEVARGFCDYIVFAYQNPRPIVTITVENATATDLAQILARTVSDRITIVDARSYVNHDFFIERLAHEVTEDGRAHRLTLGCEKVPTAGVGIYDTSVYDTARYGF